MTLPATTIETLGPYCQCALHAGWLPVQLYARLLRWLAPTTNSGGCLLGPLPSDEAVAKTRTYFEYVQLCEIAGMAAAIRAVSR